MIKDKNNKTDELRAEMHARSYYGVAEAMEKGTSNRWKDIRFCVETGEVVVGPMADGQDITVFLEDGFM